MSQLTYWLVVAAAVVLCLHGANALFYRRRFGTLLRQETRAQFKSGRLSGRQLVVQVVFVSALLVGFGAPYVAPSSLFALWLLQPYSRVVFFAWCFLGAVSLNALLASPALLRKHWPVASSAKVTPRAPGA